MQAGLFLYAMWPSLIYILLYLIGLISSLEGQRLNIAGMTYFVYGFTLIILGRIASLAVNYFIFVFHAVYGPMIMLGSLISLGFGILGILLLIVGVRAIVSAYRAYMNTSQGIP